jgi:ABC-2 type transport system ATP-binding protein
VCDPQRKGPVNRMEETLPRSELTVSGQGAGNLSLISFDAEKVISACGLTKVFVSSFLRRKVVALDGLDLDVKGGEVFGLLGPNGAGKSTAIKLMIGLLKPTSGHVHLLRKSPWDVEAKNELGYLAENPSFYPYLTAREFLDYCSGLMGVPSRERKELADRQLQEMALWEARDVKLKKFSKGMIQRLGFAQARLRTPKLLILDEPMSGLDPLGRRLVREGIFETRSRGGTVLFSSHILPDVETICDRVGILARGRLQRIIRLNGLSLDESGSVELILDGLDRRALDEIKGPCSGMRRRGDTFILHFGNAPDAQQALRLAMSRGARVLAFNRLRESLENVFIEEIESHETGSKRKAG